MFHRAGRAARPPVGHRLAGGDDFRAEPLGLSARRRGELGARDAGRESRGSSRSLNCARLARRWWSPRSGRSSVPPRRRRPPPPGRQARLRSRPGRTSLSDGWWTGRASPRVRHRCGSTSVSPCSVMTTGSCIPSRPAASSSCLPFGFVGHERAERLPVSRQKLPHLPRPGVPAVADHLRVWDHPVAGGCHASSSASITGYSFSSGGSHGLRR